MFILELFAVEGSLVSLGASVLNKLKTLVFSVLLHADMHHRSKGHFQIC